MNRLHLLFLLTVSLAAKCGLAWGRPIPDATPETLLGGPENLNLVKKAEAIEVFRAVDPDKQLRLKKLIAIDGFRCQAKSSRVTGADVQHVIAALSDMYNFGDELLCDFNPGVILRFKSDEHALDLIVCFHCHEMILYADGVIVRRPFKWAEGKNTFSRDAKRAFLAIAMKAFPDDSEIQKLNH